MDVNTAWVAGKLGNALQFDGVDDYVDCGNDASLNITNIGTVELWVRPGSHDYTTFYIILNKGDFGASKYGYRIYHQDNYAEETYKFEISDDSGCQFKTVTITKNTWHHLAMVWNGSVFVGYVDGEEQFNVTQTLNVLNNALPLTISSNNYPFNGLIDEVAIYNRALSQTEIQELYNAGLGKEIYLPDSSIVGAWHFDESL
jgi:hypothetical protein